MDKNSLLQELFSNDPLGLLDTKPSASTSRNVDERLIASFLEINDFYEEHQREPKQDGGVQEHGYYSRLLGIRQNGSKINLLKDFDQHDLLSVVPVQINSLEDVLGNDALGLLDDDSEGLFDLKHITASDSRASADFVAKRRSCKDFYHYKSLFKTVQKDLVEKKRKLIQFKEENLRAGDFYVHNGVLLYLEHVDFEEEMQTFQSGSRLRKDGRTRVIFENGTESNMLYRSLYKILLANGKAVTENSDKVDEGFYEKFGNITEEDKEAGFIYVLRSLSAKEEIKSIKNLFKIGYSTIPVEERVKKASQEPTYLMADVRIIMVYKCFNMNPQKLELLLHNFFGKSCLSIDVFDLKGHRHTPREWFIAPLDIIEQAIQMILTGEIVGHRYDRESGEIEKR